MDKIVHFEIPADNLERANKFYTSIFGWEIKKYPMEGMEYYGVCTVRTDKKHTPLEKGAINGGMQKKEKTMPYPLLTINVANIDEAIRRIKSSGGKILKEKTNIGNMGLYSRFQDPEGNILGLWQNLKR